MGVPRTTKGGWCAPERLLKYGVMPWSCLARVCLCCIPKK